MTPEEQAARIAELDDAVSGPLENITKMLETVNADTIFSGIIQTWKNENGTLKTRITELEAQVAALKEIAMEEGAYRAYYEANARTESYADFGYSLVANGLFSAARDRLTKEHPEAFR